MKKVLLMLVSAMAMLTLVACGGNDKDEPTLDNNQEQSQTGNLPFGSKKVLIAYFSWSGTTERLAREIQTITKGDLFKIEPVNPYPTDYNSTADVALQEKNSNARPAIKNQVENWNDYDVVFVGCPVWWWTAPMIINTFAESYDFTGKIVVPFVTYQSTNRDETLQKIVDLTPEAARHLSGFSNHDRGTTRQWIDRISK